MKFFIAGHKGMVGSSITKKIIKKFPEANIITEEKSNLDLTRQESVEKFFRFHKFDYVIDCAAKVGGIYSNNKYRADFIYQNLQIQNNLIHSSYLTDVKKLLFLGSSCIYPKLSSQPIKEEYLLTAPLEYSNEPYALAKIAGIKMCESYYKQYGSNFISVMPTNLYGPNDNFHPLNSHVLPALIHKIHTAKTNNEKLIEIWGSGNAKREFMHVDDMAEACLLIFEKLNASDIYSQNISQINIGSGIEISIKELVNKITEIIDFSGEIKFDLSQPDGTPRKLLDNSRLEKLGFKANIDLKEGIKDTYQWYLNNINTIKR